MPVIQRLRAIINSSLDVLEQEWEDQGLGDDDIDRPVPRLLDDAAFLPTPRFYEARRALHGSMAMLAAVTSSAAERSIDVCVQAFESGALNVVVHAKVPDILAAEDVDQNVGLSAEELQKRTGIDAGKLARLLRTLCSIHIFRETSEGVFANNRFSSHYISPKPGYYYAKALTRETMRTSSGLWDLLSNPKKTGSYAPKDTAFNVAYGTDKAYFDYLAEDPEVLQDFAIAMTGFGQNSLASTLVDYPWAALGPKTIVDIGGGHGGFSLPLLKRFPQFKLVLQDRPETLPLARKNFEDHYPEALQDGRAEFEEYDFFTPQTRKGEDYVYFMRWILHDWSDPPSVDILRSVRSAMQPGSKLIIIDCIIKPGLVSQATAGGREEDGDDDLFAGVSNQEAYEPMAAPAPLPSNFGVPSLSEMQADLTMMGLLNGVERTEAQFRALFEAAGLRLVRVFRVRAMHSVMEVEAA